MESERKGGSRALSQLNEARLPGFWARRCKRGDVERRHWSVTPSDASNPCASAPVAPDRRNSSREGIAVKPFSSSCHFTTTDRAAPVRTLGPQKRRAHTQPAAILWQTQKHRRALINCPGEKASATRGCSVARERGPRKKQKEMGTEKREALRTGYITDWFRYCSR